MTLQEFFNNVDSDKELQGVGIDTAGGKFFVEHHCSHLLTALGVESIIATDWAILRLILVGEREPDSLCYMSRIVGYYSRIDNWNKSKLGELKDRHKGSYVVS